MVKEVRIEKKNTEKKEKHSRSGFSLVTGKAIKKLRVYGRAMSYSRKWCMTK